MIDKLIERVEKGEGADRELDRRIFAKLSGWSYPLIGAAVSDFETNGRNYTASVDAVLALIEEKLPGWACKMERNSADLSWGAVWNRHSDKSAEATSPARALLAAFLRAHKEQHDGR